MPVSVFYAEWSNSILPVFFFYLAQKSERFNYGFFSNTLFSIVCSFILGFYLWLTEFPLYRVFMDTTEGPGTDMMFFQSLYGLTATGAMAVVGFLISSRSVAVTRGRKSKLVMLICIFAAILTFRRSAILVLFMSLIIMHYVGYIKSGFLRKRYIIIEIFALYGIFVSIDRTFVDFFDILFERSSMISEAFDERSDTWSYAFQDLSFIFGKGLGTAGHKALDYTKLLIADGNYFKMIAEIGIVGLLIFTTIVIHSIVVGIKEFKMNFLEVSIVFSLSLIAVGSNIFTYQSVAPIFWYAIGKVTLKSYPKQLIELRSGKSKLI